LFIGEINALNQTVFDFYRTKEAKWETKIRDPGELLWEFVPKSWATSDRNQQEG